MPNSRDNTVILINPNRRYYGKHAAQVSIGLPLGLLYIASYLEKNGIDVSVLDCLISNHTTKFSRNGTLEFGISDNIFLGILPKKTPAAIGISCPFSTQWPSALHCIRLIRKAFPKCIIVLGGAHASCEGFNILHNFHEVDYILAGEGEISFYLLLSALFGDISVNISDISGLHWRDCGAVKSNKITPIRNLDSLPLPAYHLIDFTILRRLFDAGITQRRTDSFSISIITSRGCPFKCVFCSVNASMGHTWRAHSVDYITNHLAHIRDAFKVKHVHIEDDNFTLDIARAYRIISLFSDDFFAMSWDTPNGIRADKLTEEFIVKAKHSNCTKLMVAAESGNQIVLSAIINKSMDLQHIVKCAQMCKAHGVKLGCFFTVGFPGETKDQVSDTFSFAYNLWVNYNVIPHFHVANPLPGTALLLDVERKGLLAAPVSPQNLFFGASILGRSLIKSNEISSSYLKFKYFMLHARQFMHKLKLSILKILNTN